MSDKAQPTPGPWRTERRIHSVSVMAEKRLLVVSTSWHSFERDCYPLQDEAEANARLIAAAPDMLALVERVAALNPDAGEIGAGMLVQLVAYARLAKAKATGE